MKPSVYNRSTWGKPVAVDPRLTAVSDDIFPASSIFSNDAINTAWSDDWEDEDHLDVEWFVLNFTNRNHRAKYGSGDNEFLPSKLDFFLEVKPTIGEMVFVTRRYPFALNMIALPNFGDSTKSFAQSVNDARILFPEYEALGWALLHYDVVGDEDESTFATAFAGITADFDNYAANIHKKK